MKHSHSILTCTAMGLLLSAASALEAGPIVVPSTGGWIEIHNQFCTDGGLPAPCVTSTTEAPYQTYASFATAVMNAGASVGPNDVRAAIDGTQLGGRVTASFVDVYTLLGPAGTSVSFSANLDVTGDRSSLANTAAGFGQLSFGGPGTRSSFTAGSLIHYFNGSHPTLVNETLTLPLSNILVGSTFSFATIVDLLVNTGQQADFSSTAVLGFTLPDGYYVSSQFGFSGVGSFREPAATVPEPASIGLLGAGLAICGLIHRRRRHAKGVQSSRIVA